MVYKKIVKNGWSTNILKMQISSKVYERQAVVEKVSNFENTLPDIQSDLVLQTMKDRKRLMRTRIETS